MNTFSIFLFSLDILGFVQGQTVHLIIGAVPPG
jgi:hypothetical protein